jgi:putative sterol carrier protein
MADLNTVFANLGQNLDTDKARDVNLTILFNLTGDGGGQWYAKIDNGTIDTGQGTVEDPSATLTMDADDFAAMSKGDLNPMMAFMSGKIKVDGDLNAVMQFQSLVGL